LLIEQPDHLPSLLLLLDSNPFRIIDFFQTAGRTICSGGIRTRVKVSIPWLSVTGLEQELNLHSCKSYLAYPLAAPRAPQKNSHLPAKATLQDDTTGKDILYHGKKVANLFRSQLFLVY
jgi:hypothetical protein